MTGYQSKRAAARDKLEQAKEILLQYPQKDIDWQREQQIKAHTKLLDDDDTQVYQDHPAQEPWRESASDYERGVIDGRQMQAQSSVDKAVNAMTQRPWVGMTREEFEQCYELMGEPMDDWALGRAIEAKLKEKNT